MMERIYLFVCMILPCGIYQIIMISKQKDRKNWMLHMIWVYVFLFYIYLVFQVTGIGSIWDIGYYDTIIRLDEINLKLFQAYNMIPYILNVIMFMPLGFLLPYIWKNMRSFINVLLTGFGFSIAIEVCQLFNLRCSDIDDVLMNTLGAFIGYVFWKILDIVVDCSDNKKSLSKREPIIYLLLSVLGEFVLYNSRLFF